MATRRISTDTLTDIADAIRAKTGKSAALTPLEMPGEIGSIQTGGGTGYTKKTGLFVLASDYTYNGNANGAYSGSILVATGLSAIKAILVWSEEWLDDTETNPCFGAATFYDSGFAFAADNKQPSSLGAGVAVMRHASLGKLYGSIYAGVIPSNAITGVTAGSFGLRVHSAGFPIKAGHTIRWEAWGAE